MMHTPSQDVNQLADELVDWTRRWMAALPQKLCRALKPEEVSVLKEIFLQKLEGKAVDLGNPEQLGTMHAVAHMD